jgi:hypothetical protein
MPECLAFSRKKLLKMPAQHGFLSGLSAGVYPYRAVKF